MLSSWRMDGVPPSCLFGCGTSWVEIFIKRSNSTCLQHGIGGLGSWHPEITSHEDFESSRNKDDVEIISVSSIFALLSSSEGYFVTFAFCVIFSIFCF